AAGEGAGVLLRDRVDGCREVGLLGEEERRVEQASRARGCVLQFGGEFEDEGRFARAAEHGAVALLRKEREPYAELVVRDHAVEVRDLERYGTHGGAGGKD